MQVFAAQSVLALLFKYEVLRSEFSELSVEQILGSPAHWLSCAFTIMTTDEATIFALISAEGLLTDDVLQRVSNSLAPKMMQSMYD